MSDLRFPHLERYARNVSLPGVGEEGQRKLLAAKTLVIGAGGLGSPALLYLAAAGVGTLGVADGDRVQLSNLQRQILHETADIGRPKTDSARDALLDLNPDARVISHGRITDATAAAIFAEYDIVADGSDNFETRHLVADTCLAFGKTLVSAAVIGFTGQLATFKAHLGPPHPCYRCFCPESPPPEAQPSCAASGVLGSVAGVLGAWQATEILKELLGIGESLSGSMSLFDALKGEARKLRLPRDPACRGCGAT